MSRVPAPDIEHAVLGPVRERYPICVDGQSNPLDDREHIARYVDRIVVRSGAIEIHLIETDCSEGDLSEQGSGDNRAKGAALVVPWSTTARASVKGMLHSPSHNTAAGPESRDRLLRAIAKAKAWIRDLVEGRAASLAEIAQREGKVERHIRLLAPLAFVSPRLISEIIKGVAPVDLTVTGLVRGLAYSWAKQESDQLEPVCRSDQGRLSGPIV